MIEVVNAVCSQNPMTLCPFLLRTVENTAVYIILYLFIYIKKLQYVPLTQHPLGGKGLKHS